MTAPLLEVSDLTVHYQTGHSTVVGTSGFTVSAQPGEIIAVVGESGSGKSSAAAGIMQLLPGNAESTGSVVLRHDGEEHELVGMPERARRPLRGTALSLVPQATVGALHPTRRVSKQFASLFRAHSVPKDEWTSRGVAALEAAGIADAARVLRSYPHELSGGLAQRVVIGLSQAMSPSVLVADEPTSALDVRVQRQVLTVLSETVRARQAAAIVITHDLGVARYFCDHVAVMYGAVMVEFGPSAAIFDAPSHPYTRSLLSASTARRADSSRPATRVKRRLTEESVAARCPFFDACGHGAGTVCEQGLPGWQELDGGHRARRSCDA
ncbi:peptide/nickel transport system ATP-binding protein/oligopeptide transport system ATP-binding protein [Lentzea fradiae]|uniref:Nickel import system ATP-binding protein NikD n=1 Tax=Lentzea fradiae TaxID=200378 RepID=A0A1G7R2Z1_9PSEU|nr:ABC transporter ATP-binding protein [Lentzea fradiae]SDG05097.1 peptide/nickel transport system ATP-binding protein/oligopeptide transport system ATP-binding protein [Lentzea fradiae]